MRVRNPGNDAGLSQRAAHSFFRPRYIRRPGFLSRNGFLIFSPLFDKLLVTSANYLYGTTINTYRKYCGFCVVDVLMILLELPLLSRASSVVSADVSRRNEEDIRSVSVEILSQFQLYFIL